MLYVGMGDLPSTQRFAEGARPAHPLVCDPDRKLYQAFGFGRAGVRQVVSGREIRRGVEAIRQGHWMGRIAGDPFQLGGAVVLDTSGTVRWSFRSATPSESPNLRTLFEALVAAREPES
jgi:hypothetical protein